ncbi:DUF2691 family protein [Paenibacillus tengchongensis]|uniref:DUF2691 family protein n=1 Tax=Paenibacillus tengchongensis TaxID=2608684 RepID=UPI00124E5DD1|nr:DUF2691 family protein [Paenibacillus tengchongensis]
MKRGITFKLPHQDGHFLADMLKPVDVAAYHWYNGGEEAYYVERKDNGDQSLFPEQVFGMDGAELKEIIGNHEYYAFFVDLKAFPKDKEVVNVETYEEYVSSDCQLVLLLADSVYVTIYCKNQAKLKALYDNAISQGYNKVEYVTDDNDARTGLSVW